MGKRRNMDRYLLLDLGEHFAAGRVIRDTPKMITLEVVRDRRGFRPGYSMDTVRRIVSIDERTARVLGPFSYPHDPQM